MSTDEKCPACGGEIETKEFIGWNSQFFKADWCKTANQWIFQCGRPRGCRRHFHTGIQPFVGTVIYCPYCGQDT